MQRNWYFDSPCRIHREGDRPTVATGNPLASHLDVPAPLASRDRASNAGTRRATEDSGACQTKRALWVDVVIEVPKGSFLKRGSTGHVDFVSPLPCPFNYGAVPTHLGMEGDLLDALVLGPRLRFGTQLRLRAWGAVTLVDRGMADDKLVCSEHPPSAAEIDRVLRFFRFYARCKSWLNRWRGRPGRNASEGWCEAHEAMARARPRQPGWPGPSIDY